MLQIIFDVVILIIVLTLFSQTQHTEQQIRSIFTVVSRHTDCIKMIFDTLIEEKENEDEV